MSSLSASSACIHVSRAPFLRSLSSRCLLLLLWLAMPAAGDARGLTPAATPQTGSVRLDDRTPFLHRTSHNPLGAIGEETADVSSPRRCDIDQWLFDRAELVVHENRFGVASITEAPTPGCRRCGPLRVRWYHEPTGHLSFSVNVYRRLTPASCPASQPATENYPNPSSPIQKEHAS